MYYYQIIEGRTDLLPPPSEAGLRACFTGSAPAETEYNGWKAPVPSSRLTVGSGIAFIRDIRHQDGPPDNGVYCEDRFMHGSSPVLEKNDVVLGTLKTEYAHLSASGKKDSGNSN